MIGASILVAGLFGNHNPRLAISQTLSAATGENFSFTTPVTLSESPRLVLLRGTLNVRTTPAGRWQRAGSAFSTLLSGDANLELKDAVFAFEPNSEAGDPEITADLDGSPLLKALQSWSYHSIHIERATIVRRRFSSSSDVIGTFSADLTPISKSIHIEGTFERNGEVLEASATITNPGTRRKDAPLALTGSMTGPLCDIRIQGRLMRGKDVFIAADKSTIDVPNLKALTRWLGITDYTGPGPQVFHAEGRSEWTGEALSLENANFTVDGNRAEGSLAASLSGARPVIEGTLAFSEFEVAPYLGVPATAPSTLPAIFGYLSGPFSLWPAATMEPIARVFDADIRVSLNNLMRDGRTIGKGAATVSIRKGLAQLGITGIELAAGGEGEGQMSADLMQSPPHYAVRGELRGVDISTYAGTTMLAAPIAGKGTLRADLSAAGNTEADLMASLSGSAEANLPQGARLALNIPGLFESAKIGPTKGWNNHTGKIFIVDAVRLKITAANGMVTTNSVEAYAHRLRYVAAGTLNVARQFIDLEISRVLAGPDDRPIGDAGGTTSVRIRGPMTEPEIGPASLVNRS